MIYKTINNINNINNMPRRKCKTCKKRYRRKHNKSHNVMRGGMEGQRRQPRPSWWDLAVEGVSSSHRKDIKGDAVFVSFTQDIDAAVRKRLIDNAVFLSPMFETSYKFDCNDAVPHSVIIASNTPEVLPLTFAYFCEDLVSFYMYPFDIHEFGRTAPQRINLFIKYHDNALKHVVVPIQES